MHLSSRAKTSLDYQSEQKQKQTNKQTHKQKTKNTSKKKNKQYKRKKSEKCSGYSASEKYHKVIILKNNQFCRTVRTSERWNELSERAREQTTARPPDRPTARPTERMKERVNTVVLVQKENCTLQLC